MLQLIIYGTASILGQSKHHQSSTEFMVNHSILGPAHRLMSSQHTWSSAASLVQISILAPAQHLWSSPSWSIRASVFLSASLLQDIIFDQSQHLWSSQDPAWSILTSNICGPIQHHCLKSYYCPAEPDVLPDGLLKPIIIPLSFPSRKSVIIYVYLHVLP